MQFMLGICAEKALEQHLCERFYYSYTIHIILINQIVSTGANSAFKRF